MLRIITWLGLNDPTDEPSSMKLLLLFPDEELILSSGLLVAINGYFPVWPKKCRTNFWKFESFSFYKLFHLTRIILNISTQ